MLLVLRCTTFIGVCVEFVAAVAWLAELFPEPRRREKVLGYTQAFSLDRRAAGRDRQRAGRRLTRRSLPAVDVLRLSTSAEPADAAWRYTLMSG